jgi:radical SAM superfamily enzyme YgiQ (UPF0313 family)
MKALLVWPKARTDPEWGGDLGAIAEPLSLEYLAAGAVADGHEVRILDLRLHPTALDDILVEFCPDIVGVTAYSMHVRAALVVCARVKELLGACKTVVGGHHATFLPEDFFEVQVDFIVAGEGVEPFRRLLRMLGHPMQYAPIPGLWRRRDGKFVLDQPPLQPTLDLLPIPDRLLTLGDRAHYFIDWMTPVASVRSSVGCPYRCTFCSLWMMTAGQYLRREPEGFAAEVASLQEDFVFLVDDEAFVNGYRTRALADALEAAGVRKRFFAYSRIDTIINQRDALSAWTHVGLERLFVGIDAVFDKDLKAYNKGYSVAQIERGLDVARELGIDVFAQFVINTDYSHRDFDRLARFVEHNRISYPSFTVLTPLPGSGLLANFDNVIIRQPNGRPNWDLFDTQNAVTKTRLPADEFRRAYRDLFRQFSGSYAKYRNSGDLQGKAIGPTTNSKSTSYQRD